MHGALKDYTLKWDKRNCVCVVVASGGYPGKYEKGKEIFGIKEAGKLEDTLVFHAGTETEAGKVLTNGGRVLNVTSLGDGIKQAIDKTYKACRVIKFENMHYRDDIGYRALERVETEV